MYRFVAITWNAQHPAKAELARSVMQRLRAVSAMWNCALDDDGLIILQANERPSGFSTRTLPVGAGAVVGKIFSKDSLEKDPTHPTIIDDREARAIARTGGRHLVEEYWGAYVAFLRDEESGRRYVLRDPSAALPCFRFSFNGLDLFFSYADDIEQVDFFRFSVNWDYITAFLYHPLLRIRSTGLNEIVEVLAGERLTYQGDRMHAEFLWDPRAIVRSRTLDDAQVATAAIRRTTTGCVSAWASCYDRITHQLSGGLDSSIVVSCLSKAAVRPSISCMNLATVGAEGDERAFARLVAEQAGFPLHETIMQSADSGIEKLLTYPKMCKPHFLAITSEYEDIVDSLAKSRVTDAVFSGQGGDHLFYQPKISLPAIDYVLDKGMSSGALGVFYDTAVISKKSMWHVLKDFINYRMGRWSLINSGLMIGDEHFLTADVLDAIKDEHVLHPWLQDAEGIPPGKFVQIALIVDLHGFNWPYSWPDELDVVHPMISQPLIELCLTIPTYVLTKGGIDRALARRAFKKDLPGVIIERETKGRSHSYHNEMFSKNQDFIRSFLLDGILMKKGIVDREGIEKRLSLKGITRSREISKLINCVNVEAWLRSWSDSGRRAAA